MVINFQNRMSGANSIKINPAREKVRNLEGSPIFRFLNAELTTASQELFVFEDRDSITQKYLPFDSVVLQNLSNYDIQIYVNQNPADVINVPAGEIVSISRYMWALVVRNDSGSTINASEIVILASRARADADKYAYSQMKTTMNKNPVVEFASRALPFFF